MKRLTSNTQKGIGLIEVLITTVVVAVGLLAVASLQSNFMSSSGESKIRSEARTLAEQKIEELRNNVTKNGYEDLDGDGVADTSPLTASDSHTGTNASFTRTWTITGDGLNRKNISVVVGWDANGDGDSTDPDEIVNVVTEMAWIDPAKSALYASENDPSAPMAIPSPRQNASEDVASENVDANTPTPLPGTVTATPNNDGTLPSTITVTLEGGSTAQLTPITTSSPATHFYSTSFGNGIIAVYLCSDTGLCTYIQNHFGGVPLRIAGTVYSTSGNGLAHINVAWTSSEVHACYKGQITGTTLMQMPYECVFAGNCNATDDGANNCYADSLVSDAQINARNVGPGGEYGDVGLLGVIDQTGGGQVREQLCFLEDTTSPSTSPLLNTSGSEVLNENYLFGVTKRFYAARKIHRNGSNEQISEGINRSYTNHNFLIIQRATGNTAKAECNKIAGTTADGHSIALAPREIIRPLNEATPNAVLPGATYVGDPGTAQSFIGNVIDQRTNLRLYIPETGSCYLNNNSSGSVATGYVCASAYSAASTPITSVDIIGGSNEHPADNDPAVFAKCTKPSASASDASVCEWISDFTETLAGHSSCVTPWGASVSDGAPVTAYASRYVAFNETCPIGVERTCSDGLLSDPSDAIYESCEVLQEGQCTTPWGSEFVINGDSVTAYTASSVPYGGDCSTVAETRTCTGGNLSGSATIKSCTVDPGASCPSPWIGGPDVASGQTVQAYSQVSVPFGSSCPASVAYTCTNGSYSYTANTLFQSCTVQAGCAVPSYIGTKINSVPSTWNPIGQISKVTGSGNYTVGSQSIASGTIDCATTITVGP